MIKFKRSILFMIALIISMMLLGCGNINLKSFTVINENGYGTVKLQILYDNFISSKLGNDIIDHKWAKENGYNFNKYLKNNINVEEITYNFKSIEDLQQKINSSGLATMTYLKRSGIGETTYNINLKVNKQSIDKLIKDKTNNDEIIYNYIKNIKFINEVKVPGKVIKSNATANTDENIKEWTYKLSQIDGDTNLLISYKAKK
ncbi:hypothetical protein [Clostridium saccharobutylicum]|uniref:Lipoprotein n=1 Tax=Clostridium saccharobutylicum TaxID=169679 RepID=A0A1S8MY48_CLOSA|nr:hypothetical protein [Clostridium saccharobutylicum]OOM09128.1 hypothetical protein CLOSAC_34080 [Clostridium saccharobutylicum]